MAQKRVEPENRGNKKETKTSVEEGRQEKKSADVNKLNHNCRMVGVMNQSIRLRYIHPIG